MALTSTISTKELQRQAAAAFEGKTYTVFLATNTGSLTAESTAALWLAEEVSGGGYAAVTGTIGTGSYSTGNARYELPAINATFTATSPGFTYDTVCVRIGTETYLHSILVESPNIAMAAGQSKTYSITFAQDD
jgi:hypothetical protein